MRAAMVEAAQTAANTHPHWQAELARLEPRLGRNKAIVAIARKLEEEGLISTGAGAGEPYVT